MLNSHQYAGQGPLLVVLAHGAQNLQDVEAIGKQDPYAQFSIDINNPKSFQRTFVHKDAGKTPTWNQTFTIPLAGEPELFLEIMDEETTADAVIAFAAVSINQIVHAPGATVNGIFDVYKPDGQPGGEINLTLTAYNVPGQNTQPLAGPPQPVRASSHINELHQRRVKSLKKKETMSDVGTAAAGGLLAVGAGLLVNHFVGKQQKEEEAKKEAERLKQQEHEKYEQERKKLDNERAQFQQQQQQFQQQQQSQQQQHYQPQEYHQQGGAHFEQHRQGETYGHGGSSSISGGGAYHDDHKKKKNKKKSKDSGSSSDSSDSDSDGGHKKKNKKKWGYGISYQAGDKVKYDGRKYVCLQAHHSQSDWSPNAAHSLWRST